MATTARRRRTVHPISHYWSLVKDMDDSQKLELISLLAESVKPTKDGTMSMEQMLEAYPYKRLTMDAIIAMLDEAEAEIAAGGGIPDEEAWDDLEEELGLEKQKELEMMEAV